MHGIQAHGLRALAAALALGGGAAAQVGDPQLATDHPHFPGELAMSSPERAVLFAFGVPRGSLGGSQRDRLIKLFLWRAEHFAHNVSPALYSLPGVVPDPLAGDELATDHDALRTLFSYGFGLCGANHAQMRVFAEAAGWPARRRLLNNDTGCELLVDGGWRYFNSDQYTLHFLADDASAHFASLDQVVSTPHRYAEWNPDPGLGHALPQANTHGGYQDYPGVTGIVPNRSAQWRAYYETVWDITPQQSVAMYGEGYAAAPIVVALKPGERFTRWFGPDGAPGEFGLAGRLWWGFNAGHLTGSFDGSPYTHGSFVHNAPARDELPGGPEESAGGQTYGNGCFEWAPDIAAGELEGGLFARAGPFAVDATGSLRAGGPASLVIGHYSPYAIAARPLETNAYGFPDPALTAADGLLLGLDARGAVEVELSVNAGATWSAVGALSGTGAELDLTDLVKGRNQYLIRLGFDAGEGLFGLRLRTVVMLSQGVYPTLTAGGSQITYRAGSVGALDLSPDLTSADAAESQTGWVRRAGDSGNVHGLYYQGSSYAYEATDNQPLALTWRLALPPALAARGARLERVFAAVDANVNVPAPPSLDAAIELGPTPAGPWTEIAHGELHPDGELSHFWFYGNGAAPAESEVYVRVRHDMGGYTTRLRFVRLYATYSVPESGALEVRFDWKDTAERTATHLVPAGALSDTWTVPTGASVEQRRVVLTADG